MLSGGVAAVQGMTAGLSLLGIEMGDDNKLTQTLVKSMALLQSLSTMDKAIKSFKALATVMKSNITMAGGLSKALKNLAVSNPFTAILTAVVAVGAAVAKVTSLIREQNDAMAQLNMEYANGTMQDAYDELAVKLNNQIELMKISGATDYEVFLQRKTNAKQLRDEAERNLFHYQKLSMEGTRSERKAAENFIKIWTDTYNERQKAYTDLINSTPVEQARADKAEKAEEEKRKKERQSAYNDRLNKEKEALQKRYKAQDDAYKHELSLQKQAYEQQKQQIENRYNQDIILANGNADDIAKTEKRKADAMWKINSENYTKLIKLAEDYRNKVSERDNTDGSQTANLDSLNETIISLSNSLDQAANDWQTFNHEQSIATAEADRLKESLKAETEYINKQTELTKQHNERYLALIKSRYTLQADLQAEAIRFEREQLLNDNVNIDSQLQELEAEHAAKLISEEEYLNRRAKLEQQAMENSARLRELDVEDEKNKLERKKELNEIYSQAISAISGALTSVLDAAAQQEDISFETQKKLQIASTIITTLTAAMEAYKSVAGIPLVGAYLAPVAAASTIATGMMNVRKIQQTTKNSTNTAMTTSAVQTMQTPTQMTNITGFSDNVELPDQRVYVLEQDITEAQGRVARVVTNSEI